MDLSYIHPKGSTSALFHEDLPFILSHHLDNSPGSDRARSMEVNPYPMEKAPDLD